MLTVSPNLEAIRLYSCSAFSAPVQVVVRRAASSANCSSFSLVSSALRVYRQKSLLSCLYFKCTLIPSIRWILAVHHSASKHAYRLNNTGVKQHPCLRPFEMLISSRRAPSSRNLALVSWWNDMISSMVESAQCCPGHIIVRLPQIDKDEEHLSLVFPRFLN